MNVQRTMEFILSCQAKAEVEMAAIRAQQAKAVGEMAAIRKLIRAGMKMIVKHGEEMSELRTAQRDLTRAQKVTETKLQSFIESLRRGRNGNHGQN